MLIIVFNFSFWKINMIDCLLPSYVSENSVSKGGSNYYYHYNNNNNNNNYYYYYYYYYYY